MFQSVDQVIAGLLPLGGQFPPVSRESTREVAWQPVEPRGHGRAGSTT
jgi:hypothetical protein